MCFLLTAQGPLRLDAFSSRKHACCLQAHIWLQLAVVRPAPDRHPRVPCAPLTALVPALVTPARPMEPGPRAPSPPRPPSAVVPAPSIPFLGPCSPRHRAVPTAGSPPGKGPDVLGGHGGTLVVETYLNKVFECQGFFLLRSKFYLRKQTDSLPLQVIFRIMIDVMQTGQFVFKKKKACPAPLSSDGS